MGKASADYILGHDDNSHERLIQQARILDPMTKRLFEDAGISAGMNVLDLGSGIGDVSLLLAGMVGPSGRVVGVERDGDSLAKAKLRAENAGYANVSFCQSDVTRLDNIGPLDAAVGRQILMYLSAPTSFLTRLREIVRPGGCFAFQEASYSSRIVQTSHLPLRLAVTHIVRDALQASGARTDNELTLYRAFHAAGFADITLTNEVPLMNDADNRRWLFAIALAMWPRLKEFGIAHEHVGPLETLEARLDRELIELESFAIGPGMACIHARNPI